MNSKNYSKVVYITIFIAYINKLKKNKFELLNSKIQNFLN